MQGRTILRDTDERADSPELRLKYVARFEKLLRRPQAQEVLEILRRYGRDCIPIPRKTERHYWSVSCLPSTPGKALVRVNANWMELFSRFMRTAKASVRNSWCIFRISPQTIHQGRVRWTNLFSNTAS
jgi:hypothetical protein